MNRQITIRRLLAIFLIAGLILAPLSRPVMAGTTPDAAASATADHVSSSATAGPMASDMPCCPTKAPAAVDCDKCVFMAACVNICFAGPSAVTLRLPFATSGQIAAPRNDSIADGFGLPPPEHPPRTSA